MDGGQALCEAAGSGPTVCDDLQWEPRSCKVGAKLLEAKPLGPSRRQSELRRSSWWALWTVAEHFAKLLEAGPLYANLLYATC